MKTLNKIFVFVFVIFLVSTLTSAQDVISAKEAASLLKDDNVVFVSARTPSDYKKVHVPGAVNIDHKSLYGEMAMLKPVSELAEILGNNGISADKKIVIYDDGSMKYSGRLYWIFTYLGADDVLAVDGGMKAWRMARKPVTRNPSNPDQVTFTPKVNNAVLASMSEVKKAVNNAGYTLVDARTPAEFEGTATTKLRPGHIPSAVNLNYENILNSDGTLKPNDELRTIFNNAGIASSKTVIVYCETSVRAGIVFLALKSALNYPNVKIYDGAYTEWQSVDSNVIGAE